MARKPKVPKVYDENECEKNYLNNRESTISLELSVYFIDELNEWYNSEDPIKESKTFLEKIEKNIDEGLDDYFCNLDDFEDHEDYGKISDNELIRKLKSEFRIDSKYFGLNRDGYETLFIDQYETLDEYKERVQKEIKEYNDELIKSQKRKDKRIEDAKKLLKEEGITNI